MLSEFAEELVENHPEFLLPLVLDHMGISKPPEFWIKSLQKQPDGLPLPQRIYFSDAPMQHQKPEWHILPAYEDEYADIFYALREGESSKELHKRLLALQENNPLSPLPLNLLCTLYSLRNDKKKVMAVLEQTVAAFPDYLFGWVNLGLHAMQTDQPEKAIALLKGKYEIYEHVPLRMYHITEIGSFYALACLVHCHEGRLLRAVYASSQVLQSHNTEFEKPDEIMLCLKGLTTHFSEDELLRLNTLTQRKLRKLR